MGSASAVIKQLTEAQAAKKVPKNKRSYKIYKKEKMASVTPLDKMVAVTLYWKFALIYCTVYRACRTLHYTRVPGCII